MTAAGDVPSSSSASGRPTNGNDVGGTSSGSSSSLNSMPVSSIMVHEVKTVREEQTVLDVCRIMHQYNIGSVVVVASREGENKNITSNPSPPPSSDYEPTGIVTERDIVRHIAIKLIGIQAPVHDVMSRPAVTVRPETSLAEAIQIMQTRDFRRLVVVDENGLLAGIITDKDIFRAIARNPAVISDLLGGQQASSPSSLMATDKGLLDQSRMESLGELFRPKHS